MKTRLVNHNLNPRIRKANASMSHVAALYCLILSLSLTTHAYKSYDEYKILRVTTASDTDYKHIHNLEAEDSLEVISESRSRILDVLISPEKLDRCQSLFESQGLPFQIINDNVGSDVRKERGALLSAANVAKGSISYSTYHRLNVLYDHLDALAASHNDKAETFNLTGTTYERRKMQVIRITANVNSPASKDRPMIWIDGGIHAREWVSPATVMYITDSLLGEQEQARSAEMALLLEKYQFVIAPSINPDGYEYTHEEDRLWRKTRKPTGCKDNKYNWFGGCFYRACFGADSNRNWSTDWGRESVSTDPCSIFYPGKVPFDQDNVMMVKTYLEEQQSKLKGYISYHSYSQLFLLPLAYTVDPPPDRNHHLTVGAAVVAAIKNNHGQTYTAQSFADMYPASGVSADWAYQDLNITDSYTIELRDLGEFAFELPEDQILETAEENVSGLMALLDNIQQ